MSFFGKLFSQNVLPNQPAQQVATQVESSVTDDLSLLKEALQIHATEISLITQAQNLKKVISDSKLRESLTRNPASGKELLNPLQKLLTDTFSSHAKWRATNREFELFQQKVTAWEFTFRSAQYKLNPATFEKIIAQIPQITQDMNSISSGMKQHTALFYDQLRIAISEINKLCTTTFDTVDIFESVSDASKLTPMLRTMSSQMTATLTNNAAGFISSLQVILTSVEASAKELATFESSVEAFLKKYEQATAEIKSLLKSDKGIVQNNHQATSKQTLLTNIHQMNAAFNAMQLTIGPVSSQNAMPLPYVLSNKLYLSNLAPFSVSFIMNHSDRFVNLMKELPHLVDDVIFAIRSEGQTDAKKQYMAQSGQSSVSNREFYDNFLQNAVQQKKLIQNNLDTITEISAKYKSQSTVEQGYFKFNDTFVRNDSTFNSDLESMFESLRFLLSVLNSLIPTVERL